MKTIPLTFAIDYYAYNEADRPVMLEKFASAGGKHLVLTPKILSAIAASPHRKRELSGELAALGLSFVDSHAPHGGSFDLHCLIDDERSHVAELLKLYMAIARDLNVKTMTFHPGSDHVVPEMSSTEHRERICRMLDELLPTAEKYDIVMALENSWSVSNTAEALLAIKEKYPTKHLGFCYDSGHANIMDNGRLYSNSVARERWQARGYTEPEWDDSRLEKMLPYVVNCHLHDNDGSADTHQMPGSGNVNWPHITSLLKKAPHLQAIQCEVHHLKNNIDPAELPAVFQKLFQQD